MLLHTQAIQKDHFTHSGLNTQDLATVESPTTLCFNSRARHSSQWEMRAWFRSCGPL